MMLSPHQEENCMVIEMHLRNFPQHPALGLRWAYPCWQRAPEVDPTALMGAKRGKGQAGRPAAITPEQLAAFLAIPGLQDLSKTDLANLAGKVMGVSSSTSRRRLKELKTDTK